MAENVAQTVEVPVPISLFGSLVTEMNPADLPEGTSPDNQDIVYLPGGVTNRPGMRKWLAGLPAGTTVTYVKTFVNPQGISLNLILTSDGQFWVQNTSVPPYTPTLLGDVTPGSYASSVTAFGKELITFHNNSYGTDIPRTYDGQYFDRATQCGPGAPPVVQNTILPPSSLAVSPAANLAVSVAVGVNPFVVGGVTSYEYIHVTFAAPVPITSLPIGDYGIYNSTGGAPYLDAVTTVFELTIVAGMVTEALLLYGYSIGGPDTGGILALGASSLSRGSNTVTANTAVPHNLELGYQVQISGVGAFNLPLNIDTVVIDNEDSPGIATITTDFPHYLLPNNLITMAGITGSAVGGGISNIAFAGGLVTVTTAAAHNLIAGSQVLVAANTNATVNGLQTVVSAPTTTTFTFAFDSIVNAYSAADTGTITYQWPPNEGSLLENYYTVLSAPTATTFTIAINYTDGTWNNGTISFAWSGVFTVTNIISATQFQYQQYGPTATTTDIGLVTPTSQISPGVHQCVVLFQTRTGFITAPSPPVQFVANGGQYLTVSNIPIGPSNVVKRFLAFSGAGGDNFFYIPVPAFVNGLVVSTSTAINDNATTSVLVDFSDNTLFASTAIDITGFNLFQMRTLGPCLGVSSYASRSSWFGMHNSVPNFLNLGFEGGYLSGNLLNPLGWSVESAGGILDTVYSVFGQDWLITGTGGGAGQQDGLIQQSAYSDVYGIPILSALLNYSMQLRLTKPVAGAGNNGSLTVDFYSPTSGVLATCTFLTSTLLSTPQFLQANFSNRLPITIPEDTVLRVYGLGLNAGTEIAVDEIEIYPTLNPFVPQFNMSYVNLPEAIDQLTGVIGASDDSTPIQATFEYRDALLFLTQAKLHETNDIAGLEPSSWRVREVSNNCGACGPRSISTGENFSVWVASPSSTPPVGRGLYIYTGGSVYKLSQEIQPDFDAINMAAQNSIWVQNDSVTRRIYVGAPMQSATAPSRIYVLDYREMDSAAEIASKAPIHISFTGKMICSDLSRKWTRWSIPANCGGIVYVPGIGLQFVVGGGNGEAPGMATGFANAYWFDTTLYTDQDYGQIVPYYMTYFFVNHEMEQQIQVGLHRKLYKRWAAYITGIGQLQITPYANSTSNPWPAGPLWPLSLTQDYDIGDGLNVSTERCAFKISTTPYGGQTDNAFNVSKLIITLSQEPVSPIRFGAV